MTRGLTAMRYRVLAPLVVAKDRAGRAHHRYTGELIDWLPSDQATHLLELGMVEDMATSQPAQIVETPEPDPIAEANRAAAQKDQERVESCMQALALLGVNALVGAPAARRALREEGRRFSNATIAEAVRQRQKRRKQPWTK
jgi:hypothetical protein